MVLRRLAQGRDPSPLSAVLEETAELPRGARRVLEGVFWGVGHDERSEARIVPLSRVLASPLEA